MCVCVCVCVCGVVVAWLGPVCSFRRQRAEAGAGACGSLDAGSLSSSQSADTSAPLTNLKIWLLPPPQVLLAAWHGARVHTGSQGHGCWDGGAAASVLTRMVHVSAPLPTRASRARLLQDI